MLAEQRHRRRGRRARASARRSTRSRWTTSARVAYDGTYEDLFFYVERLIVAACGEDVAGRLHTARSRNDIDMTMYRMRQREFILGADRRDARRCARSLLDLADRAPRDVFAAHTHTQPAQPTTVAHYLLAVIEQLERDAVRLRGGLREHEPQPARRLRDHRHRLSDRSRADDASCSASTGRPATPTAASRRWTTCSRASSATAVLLDRPRPRRAGPAALVHERVRLPAAGDGFVQCSSIMPQKRNPGRARARARDRQQGARPGAGDRHRRPQHAVRRHRRHRGRSAAARGVDVPGRDPDGRARGGGDVDRGVRRGSAWRNGRGRAGPPSRSWPTRWRATTAVPFRRSHEIATRLVAEASRRPGAPLDRLLADVSKEVLGHAIEYSAAALAEVLSPQHFVRVRTTPGGPAPSQTRCACDTSTALLAADQNRLAETVARLRLAEKRLDQTAAAL